LIEIDEKVIFSLCKIRRSTVTPGWKRITPLFGIKQNYPLWKLDFSAGRGRIRLSGGHKGRNFFGKMGEEAIGKSLRKIEDKAKSRSEKMYELKSGNILV
jgi:hypothetical protein